MENQINSGINGKPKLVELTAAAAESVVEEPEAGTYREEGERQWQL